MVRNVDLIKMKCRTQVVINWSICLEKHQIIKISLRVDIYAFLKILRFSKFVEIVEIHQ